VFYVFLVIVGVIGVSLYVTMFVREVPGFKEQRFGKLEDLPSDLGKWRADTDSSEGARAKEEGLKREVRHWLDSQTEKLYFQVRYRNLESNEIVRTDDDVEVKRRRIKV
jgi:hypothetical protein